MKQKNKPSPAAGEFLFEIDSEPLEECVTALGGVPLLVRAARSLDVPGSVQRHLQVKQRQRGFDEASYVESFLVLNAVGGSVIPWKNQPSLPPLEILHRIQRTTDAGILRIEM
jgi:hypothetical protein